MNQLSSIHALLADTDLVICDLGGVLYDIDFNRTISAMQALPGYNNKPIHFGVELQDDLFVQYDRGTISSAEFRDALREKFAFSADDEAIDTAWRAVLIGPFDFARDLVLALRSSARVVLLSNISDLHLRKCLPECRHFFSEFDALYFSCRINKRKPAAEAFLHVCEMEGTAPERTVLIDDSISNCNAAEALGIRPILVSDLTLLRQYVAASLSGKR